MVPALTRHAEAGILDSSVGLSAPDSDPPEWGGWGVVPRVLRGRGGMRRRWFQVRFRFVAALALAAGGALVVPIEEPRPIREYFREPTPHEAYRLGLSRSGLSNTALGQDWIRAGERALSGAPELSPPFREEGYFPPEEPMARGYVFELERGQVVRARVELEGAGVVRTFLDLYRAAPDTARPPVPVASADSVGRHLEFEVARAGRYILRLQPELLRGGRYRLDVRVGPSLVFPVSGRDTRAVQSFFGAPRDGGRREHHGVDIFAPRNTPVVAAVEGYVRVDTGRRGGNVIWLRDARRRQSLYYAHLERQLVASGDRVRPGDTIGLVGNSGNARTTPTHLHFGVYRRGEGPVNPWHFIHDSGGEVREVVVDPSRLGKWVRVTDGGIHLRVGPAVQAGVARELERHMPLRVLGAVGDWLRVRLPDGETGFVAGRLTESVDPPLGVRVASVPTRVASEPRPEAPVMETVEAGSDLELLGAFGHFLYVRPREGRAGWIEAD